MNTIKILALITAPLFAAAFLHAGDATAPGDDAQTNIPGIYQSGTHALLASSTLPPNTDDIIVFKLAGDGQMTPAGQWNPASLEAGVWSGSGMLPLPNVPVDFSLVEGGGWLAKAPGPDTGLFVQILTDTDGVAQVWHRQPDQANVQSIITASALGKSVAFTTFSIMPGDTPPPVNAPGTSSTTDDATKSSNSGTATVLPARPTQGELLVSLATAQGTRRTAKSGQPKTETAQKPSSSGGSFLPDEYFDYPADHPFGRMQRGLVLYAAAGKARELRDTEQACELAAEAKEWLALALEDEGGMDDASVARCHYYLGRISERYNGNQAGALIHYRAAGEKDAAHGQAKASARRIEASRTK